MEQKTDPINKKAKRSINIYPFLYSFAGDLIFFVPIDTLYLTLVKGLSASQITAMTMVSLIVCILCQKLILIIVKKIGNANAVRCGVVALLGASLILTFGKSFILMLIYKCLFEIAFIFLSMDKIVLRNNLSTIGRKDDYPKIRNRAKIMYSVITLLSALVVGKLFNINYYLPLYLNIVLCALLVGVSLLYCETKITEDKIPDQIPDQTAQPKAPKKKPTWLLLLMILSNAIFYSIIKMGQSNSKLFMQYDFQAFLSVEMLTYYITTIVVISRVARLLGNIIFGKLYLKIKDKMSIVLTICLSMAFALLITGHFVNVPFIYKVIIMSLGFFLILATRDSFQVYIEDVALSITNKKEYQKIIIDIEMTRRLGTLILSGIFTLILINHDLIVIEFILLGLSIVEIFINCRLCSKLKKLQ